MAVDLCYILSHGFAARMILHSGILPRLRQLGVTVAIVSPDGDEPGMRDAAEKLGFITRAAPAEPTALERFAFKQMQRYLFDDIPKNPALWAKHLRQKHDAGQHPIKRALPAALLGANRLAREFGPAAAALRALRARLVKSPGAARILAELAPRMVVSTYPVSMIEASFLLEARRAGVPTTCQLLSWDNITCKGQFPVLADEYIVWGPIMARELEAYYQVDPARIHRCGVAHFDAHLDPGVGTRRHAALRALALDPARPYIFQGMSSPYFAPHEIDIVEWLARAVTAGDFGDDMQLVVRPHPQNIQGDMADRAWLPRLDALVNDRVAVDYPRLRKSKLAWSMDEGDLPHLAGLLAGCAVCLNSGSTLSIDAIMHDRPVVITGFDAQHQLPWWKSARRALEYLHIAKFVALGGVRVAHSLADLERCIQQYLADPSLDSAGREHARTEQCGVCDGRASGRIADTLHQLVTAREGSLPSSSPRSVA